MNSFDFKQLNLSGLTQAFTAYMPAITSGALVIVLAQSLADVTWDLMPENPFVPPPETSAGSLSGTSAITASSTMTSYSKITGFHLFGTAENEAAKPAVVAPTLSSEDAPDTQLRLTLKGVVASSDMMEAWAIVADRTGNEDGYGIGGALPGGATLKEIYSDRIILLYNGRLETLRLPKVELKGSTNVSAISNNRGSNTRRSTRRTSAITGSVNRLSSQATQTLRDYKDKLLNDPQSVMNSVRAEPYRQGGKLKGYRIFPGKDKQLFGQIGLEPGDIVTSVNGIELDSPLKGLEIMQQLSDTSNVSVNVLRNGVSQTFESSLN